jgi:hypothetical protein
MDKQALIKSMKEYTKGTPFINTSEIARFLRRSRDALPELVGGLDYLQTGREKKYFIPDVAERIMNQRQTG